VSKREVQKINTYSLPVPGSFDVPDPVAAANIARLVVVDDDEGDQQKEGVDGAVGGAVDLPPASKDLVSFLGMKDGITASMASQVSELNRRNVPKLASCVSAPSSFERQMHCLRELFFRPPSSSLLFTPFSLWASKNSS